MAGALLRSGNLREFHPLGAVGRPAYSAATQLLTAIRRQLGDDVADLFAVPQVSDRGDTIDWYAPRDGDVVPWTSASPEERAEAKAKLLEARAGLEARAAELSEDPDSERQVFGKLLAQATQIPSDDHVQLVDGRPVITFWGFHPLDAPSGLDVIAGLDTAGPAPVAAAAAAPVAAAVVARRRWPWWLWLLLLLLLLLLLCWLFCRCSPEAPLPLPLEPPVVERPEDEDPERLRERVVDDLDDSRVRVEGGGFEDREGIDVDSLGEEELGTESNTPEEPLAEEDETGALEEETGEPPLEEDPEGDGSDEPPGDEEPGEPLPDPDAPLPGDEAGGPRDGAAGAPLEIPEEALSEGSTEFLEGKWRSTTGLETADHEPVELSYDFKDGKGQVQLHRGQGADRVDCTGRATSEMTGGRLVISHKDIRCPDGSGFQDSRVECSVGEDGKAGCGGVNAADGTKYDVDITR